MGAPGSENGKVYVFFGDIGFSGIMTSGDADITIASPGGAANFGKDIFRLEDVNDDSFLDFAIGSDTSIFIEY